MKLRNIQGFTLSELMIASLILAFTLVGMLGFITNLVATNEANRNMLIAVTHAQYILEEIRGSGRTAPVQSRIQAGQWNLSAEALAAGPYNLLPLSEETITTAVFQSGNPLGINVTVAWVDHSQRNRTLVLNTLIAE